MSDFVCCFKCTKHLDVTPNMFCDCGIICGECFRRGFLSIPPDTGSHSRKFICPDCKKEVDHADISSEEKRDEGPRSCPFKEHGCFFWGSPPEIHEHIQCKKCVGKGLTDLAFLIDQLIQLEIETGTKGQHHDEKVRSLMEQFQQLYMQLSQQLSQQREMGYEGEELDKKKRDEGLCSSCPYKCHGCYFWGTPPEIHKHIWSNICFGKQTTDLLFDAKQLIQLFQLKKREGRRYCPYKGHGCSFWGTPSEIDKHIQCKKCSGKRITDAMFKLNLLNESGFSHIG